MLIEPLLHRSISTLCTVLLGAVVVAGISPAAIGQGLHRVELTVGAIDGFDYYVDANQGRDTNPGTAQSPWQTLKKARQAAAPGSTIGVVGGDYPLFLETRPYAHDKFLTFRATPGKPPVLAGIALRYPGDSRSYLRFEGFEIYSDTAGSLVELRSASHVQVVGCTIHADKWARNGAGVDAFRIATATDILIERNRVFEVFRGVTATNSARMTVRGNYIRVKAGTGIQYAGGNEDGVIEYNHIQGEPYVGHTKNPDAVVNPHASVISVRSSDLTIRGNHMHGLGNSSGIMFYTPDVAGGETEYSNILMENNALYDIHNTYAVRMYNLGTNVVLRNNLIFSRARTGTCKGLTGDARYRYSNALLVHNLAPGHDGSGLELYNNIFIGVVSVPNKVRERNNIAWSWGEPWRKKSPSGTSLIVTDAYCGCGKHPRFFESSFFATAPDFTFPRPDVADWTLAPDSVGRAFGDPTVQPKWSLGSIGPNGFLRADGPPRLGSVRSVGPFVEHLKSPQAPK